MNKIFIWLDDIRPAPRGFTHVKTIQEAKTLLETGHVAFASLDHDLGACDECSQGMTPDEWLEKHNYASMPNCSHFGTGYDLVCWMEETGHWPTVYWPTVHSANAVGRRRMEQAIEREQDRRAKEAGGSSHRETRRADSLEDQAIRQDRVARQLGARRIESVPSRPGRDRKAKGTRPKRQRPRRAKPRRVT
jgi:hypothetical protein